MDLNITFLDWAGMIGLKQDPVMTESVVVLVTIELAEVTVKMQIFGDIIDDPDIPVTCGEGYGSDRISGGAGNDRLYHGLGTPDDSKAILSDGHKDFIDCGSGEDSVWINTSVDHDVASSCEHVHAG